MLFDGLSTTWRDCKSGWQNAVLRILPNARISHQMAVQVDTRCGSTRVSRVTRALKVAEITQTVGCPLLNYPSLAGPRRSTAFEWSGPFATGHVDPLISGGAELIKGTPVLEPGRSPRVRGGPRYILWTGVYGTKVTSRSCLLDGASCCPTVYASVRRPVARLRMWARSDALARSWFWTVIEISATA